MDVLAKEELIEYQDSVTKRRFKHLCFKCGYKWRSQNEFPKQCANCRSINWKKENTERVEYSKLHSAIVVLRNCGLLSMANIKTFIKKRKLSPEMTKAIIQKMIKKKHLRIGERE